MKSASGTASPKCFTVGLHTWQLLRSISRILSTLLVSVDVESAPLTDGRLRGKIPEAMTLSKVCAAQDDCGLAKPIRADSLVAPHPC